MNGIAVASADGSIVLSVGGMSISMDRADALALCSRIRAVAGSPWDRGVPESMDLVRFYILKDRTWNSREVFVVARDAQGTWWTTIVDWHGVASIDPMRGRPSVTQLKPYILVKDLADVEPVFSECRDIYALRVLDDVGLGPLADFDPGVGFVDAAVDEEAARFAGIPFVYASYGFGRVQSPDAVLAAPGDLLGLLSFPGEVLSRPET